ncbi:MAG: DoxX family protein [Vulcanimicrobiaceae bacterium]
MRKTLPVAALFLISGTLHFVRPGLFEPIVPPRMGDPRALVALTGAAEIAGALGLLIPATRRAAGLGLIALLLAVWPANIHMALEAKRFRRVAPAWLLWARVPLQIPLIGWVERVSR